MGTLSVDGPRLTRDLSELGNIGRVEAGGLSRTSFSVADTEARSWYLGRCADAGLDASIDGIGNIVVSIPVSRDFDSLPAVWTGSHIDTVPNGGRFDGALGAIAALECLRRIREEELELKRPVRAVVYTDEEGNYAHLLGSSALARGYTLEALEEMTGREGDRFVDAFVSAGGDVEAATRTKLSPDSLHATVELHIEQGPVLEQQGVQIGVVTGIVGLGGGDVIFRGRADHAGTTPMLLRKDALSSAAALLVSLPGLAAEISDRAVITAGIIDVEPASSNVVPGTARVTLDFRDLDEDRVDALRAAIVSEAERIAAADDIDVDFVFETTIAPTPLDLEVQRLIADVASNRGFSTLALPSGAGHDSQNMATLAPTGMIFVPSIGGRSHCPEEDTSWVDVENGANVLLDTLIRLASD